MTHPSPPHSPKELPDIDHPLTQSELSVVLKEIGFSQLQADTYSDLAIRFYGKTMGRGVEIPIPEDTGNYVNMDRDEVLGGETKRGDTLSLSLPVPLYPPFKFMVVVTETKVERKKWRFKR